MSFEIAGHEQDCVVLVDKAAKRIVVVLTNGEKGAWEITRHDEAQALKKRDLTTFAWALQFMQIVRP